MGAIKHVINQLRSSISGGFPLEVDDYELVDADAELFSIVSVLKELEVTGYMASGHCPICKEFISLSPHKSDCKLYLLLKELSN